MKTKLKIALVKSVLLTVISQASIASDIVVQDGQTQINEIRFEQVREIFEKRCNGCHAQLDHQWSNYEFMFEKRHEVYNRVVVLKNMPLYSKLPEGEREIIRLWVEQGALP